MKILQNQEKINVGAVNIRVIITVFLALIGALVIGKSMGTGDYLTGYLLMLVVVFISLLQYLRKSFWIAIPFFMEAEIPAIPLGFASITGGELWILTCCLFVLVYWVGGGKRFSLNIKSLWPIYLYGIWAFVIFVQNPVGLTVFGASAGGFRFYTMIGFGVIACTILSNANIDSDSAKKILILFLVAAVTKVGLQALQMVFPSLAMITAQSGGSSADEFYGFQYLAVFPAMVVPVIFASYSLKDLLKPKHFWVTAAYGFCIIMVLVSGKRSLTAVVLICPILSEMIRGRFFGAMIIGGAGSVLVFILLMAHNSGIRLKPEIQRVLSVVPGDYHWDNEVERSAENGFRETLNRLALKEIGERPILGEGYKVDQEFLFYLEENPGAVLEGDDHLGGAKHAANSNWHNTWLGIAADFGIPGACIYLALNITLLTRVYRCWRILDSKNYVAILLLLGFILVITELLRSWQFGHSGLSFYVITWKFGILVAVEKMIRGGHFQQEYFRRNTA